jgi:hypothetical protein
MGIVTTTITLDRKNRAGKLLQRRQFPSRSWTKHFFDLFYEHLAYNSNTLASINDISSTGRNLNNTTQGLVNLSVASTAGGSIAPAFKATMQDTNTGNPQITVASNSLFGGEQNGIVVGTGNTAVTPADDKLATRILHGTGASLLEYSGCEVLIPTFANPNGAMDIRRYFTNNSGGSITVQEVGLYSFGYKDSNDVYSYCICRDVVSPGVAVANTELLSVVYTVQITV